jgi:hypothetical protein
MQLFHRLTCTTRLDAPVSCPSNLISIARLFWSRRYARSCFNAADLSASISLAATTSLAEGMMGRCVTRHHTTHSRQSKTDWDPDHRKPQLLTIADRPSRRQPADSHMRSRRRCRREAGHAGYRHLCEAGHAGIGICARLGTLVSASVRGWARWYRHLCKVGDVESLVLWLLCILTICGSLILSCGE